MSRYDELTGLVNDLGPDFAKFYDKGNKAAGTRVRTVSYTHLRAHET